MGEKGIPQTAGLCRQSYPGRDSTTSIATSSHSRKQRLLWLRTARSLQKGLSTSRWHYFSGYEWSTATKVSAGTAIPTVSAAADSSAVATSVLPASTFTVCVARVVLPAEPPTPDLPAGSSSSFSGSCRSCTGWLWRRIWRRGEGEGSRLRDDATPAPDRTIGEPSDWRYGFFYYMQL